MGRYHLGASSKKSPHPAKMGRASGSVERPTEIQILAGSVSKCAIQAQTFRDFVYVFRYALQRSIGIRRDFLNLEYQAKSIEPQAESDHKQKHLGRFV